MTFHVNRLPTRSAVIGTLRDNNTWIVADETNTVEPPKERSTWNVSVLNLPVRHYKDLNSVLFCQ